MRKLVAVVLVLCTALLAGCTNDSLVGVYTSDSASYQVVLHEDGTAEYAGKENVEWKTKGDKVIISTRYTHYSLEVFLDPAVLSEAEMKAVCTKINTIENVKSTSIGLNVISVSLEKEDTNNQVKQAIEKIEGVASVSVFTWEPEINIKFTVKNGCLVKDGGSQEVIFRKIEN